MAISEGVNVVGTLAWSIYDNFEWSQGYSVKFGIQVGYLEWLLKWMISNECSMSILPLKSGTTRQARLSM